MSAGRVQRACLASLIALSALGGVANAAELVTVQWTPEGRFEYQATIAPKRFLEVCDKLASGERVTWKFSSGAALDFNIHFHEGTAASYPVKRNGTQSESGVFESRKTTDYCWMWANRGALPVSITLAFERNR